MDCIPVRDALKGIPGAATAAGYERHQACWNLWTLMALAAAEATWAAKPVGTAGLALDWICVIPACHKGIKKLMPRQPEVPDT